MAKKWIGYNQNFYSYTCPKEKLYMQCAENFIPSLFMPKIGCSNTLKIENLQNVQNPEGYPQKENRQRTVRSSACCSLYFRNRNRIVRSRFRLSYFVTVLTQVSARTLSSSAAMQIEIRLWTLAAHAGRNFCIRFFICSNRAFCCSVRAAAQAWFYCAFWS